MLRFAMHDVRIRHLETVAAVNLGCTSAIMKCCLLVQREAMLLVRIPAGEPPIPSEPGEPPHLRTGELGASISSALTSPVGGVVGPTAKHGKWQEFGTKDGKLPKRPFMRPALARTKKKFAVQFANLKLKGRVGGT